MKERNGHITAFYLETLLLIVVLIAMILVLTQVFGLAQRQSTQAQRLTDAVALAGNAAEAVSASDSEEELFQLLNENENAVRMKDPAGVTAAFGKTLQPDPAGSYHVEVSWYPEETQNGVMIHSVILVRFDNAEEPIYRLETESFRQEVDA